MRINLYESILAQKEIHFLTPDPGKKNLRTKWIKGKYIRVQWRTYFWYFLSLKTNDDVDDRQNTITFVNTNYIQSILRIVQSICTEIARIVYAIKWKFQIRNDTRIHSVYYTRINTRRLTWPRREYRRLPWRSVRVPVVYWTSWSRRCRFCRESREPWRRLREPASPPPDLAGRCRRWLESLAPLSLPSPRPL